MVSVTQILGSPLGLTVERGGETQTGEMREGTQQHLAFSTA